MARGKSKEYKLEIDPRILELLGPSLYTNIYYVLAELIANAYDADAKNVYITSNKDDITVEDDGHGMSYEDGDVARYLNVGGATRDTEQESLTRSGKRRRMGRKGVGKLAALSVSENVDIMTKADNELSGFVLSRRPPHGNLLEPIPNKKIKFEHVKKHGSAVVMRKPQYRLHKSLDAVKRNLLKIFPLVGRHFRIHVFREKEKIVIDSFDANVMKELAVLITLGDEFKSLSGLVESDYPKRRKDLVQERKAVTIPVRMRDTHDEEHEYSLTIEGWIGAYKTTRGRKAEITDFPDNFISLYANKKMGEFNILPSVGQNKLNEVYVVGQLHVDLFELTELPDMALSNRQGYKSDDPRYEAVLDYVRKTLLNDVLRMRDLFADIGNEQKKKKKLEEQRRMEAALRAEADKFRRKVAETTAKRLAKLTGATQSKIQQVISEVINTNQPSIGLKQRVDSLKKRILISQTYGDKPFADIVYQMLLFNGVPAEDILYTNCDDELSRIPEDEPVYGYLRDFFVDSYSTQKIFVVFLTSTNTKQSWGAITEVGAAWITQVDNKIFNLHPFRPEHPLDDSKQWQSTNRDDKGDLWMTPVNADVFCQKIEAICEKLGYAKKNRAANKQRLGTLVSIRKKK
ncbi:ATP-binding protein [Botrimarina sp.]|uniref:ATP-binding protein n=1 Tax=Botrimarina sp. TaxID=2795802 RepID=UPI0032EC3748